MMNLQDFSKFVQRVERDLGTQVARWATVKLDGVQGIHLLRDGKKVAWLDLSDGGKLWPTIDP